MIGEKIVSIQFCKTESTTQRKYFFLALTSVGRIFILDETGRWKPQDVPDNLFA